MPSIVPLLEKEYRNAARRLEDTQDELTDLHPDKRAARVGGVFKPWACPALLHCRRLCESGPNV